MAWIGVALGQTLRSLRMRPVADGGCGRPAETASDANTQPRSARIDVQMVLMRLKRAVAWAAVLRDRLSDNGADRRASGAILALLRANGEHETAAAAGDAPAARRGGSKPGRTGRSPVHVPAAFANLSVREITAQVCDDLAVAAEALGQTRDVARVGAILREITALLDGEAAVAAMGSRPPLDLFADRGDPPPRARQSQGKPAGPRSIIWP